MNVSGYTTICSIQYDKIGATPIIKSFLMNINQRHKGSSSQAGHQPKCCIIKTIKLYTIDAPSIKDCLWICEDTMKRALRARKLINRNIQQWIDATSIKNYLHTLFAILIALHIVTLSSFSSSYFSTIFLKFNHPFCSFVSLSFLALCNIALIILLRYLLI